MGFPTDVGVVDLMIGFPACYYPAGLTIERSFAELPTLFLKDGVGPKFLRENAVQVFKLGDIAS